MSRTTEERCGDCRYFRAHRNCGVTGFCVHFKGYPGQTRQAEDSCAQFVPDRRIKENPCVSELDHVWQLNHTLCAAIKDLIKILDEKGGAK